jgi:hypothetical protein
LCDDCAIGAYDEQEEVLQAEILELRNERKLKGI